MDLNAIKLLEPEFKKNQKKDNKLNKNCGKSWAKNFAYLPGDGVRINWYSWRRFQQNLPLNFPAEAWLSIIPI